MAKRKIDATLNESFFKRHKQKVGTIITVLITASLVFGIWKVSNLNNLQKDQTYNYVCQVVGADTDLGMLAMKCMAK